jgi:glutamate dehydrogenase (NAD(P)+)
MVQNIMRYCWSFEEVHQKLDERMTTAYQGVLAASKKYKINMRQAAYTVAVDR